MKWIDEGKLKYWYESNTRHCQQTLPELIWRLLATDPSALRKDFPSRDSITTGGLDGYLETSTI